MVQGSTGPESEREPVVASEPLGVTPVVLPGGQTVAVRLIEPSDAPRLQRFHERLSRRSIYFRFFGAMPHLSDQQAKHFAEVDYLNRLALVALDPEEPDEIIGVARFDRAPGKDEAELAIVVADRYQGQGLGRVMLSLLVEAARARGITRLLALVLLDNPRMIDLLRRLGFPYQETWEDGMERLTLEIGADQPA